MKKFLAVMVLLVSSVFMVTADELVEDRGLGVALGVAANVVFDEFSVGLAIPNFVLDRIGVYSDVNFSIDEVEDTEVSLTLGISVETLEDLYLFGGGRVGIQSVSETKAELGLEYYPFETIGFNVRSTFPFEWDGVSVGVRFKI